MIKKHKKKIIGVMLIFLCGILLITVRFQGQHTVRIPQFEKDKKVNFLTFRNQWKEIINSSSDGTKNYSDFKRSAMNASVSDAHFSAHIFGELLFDKWGEKAIKICDTAYEYGCYHGVAVEAISKKGTSVISTFIQTCKELASSNANNLMAPCIHGIGHGIVEYFGHSENKLLIALKACSKDDPYTNRICYSGVFMEYNVPILVTDTDVSVTNRPLIKGKEYSPCTTIPQMYQASCYEQISQWWPIFYHNDLAKVAELCSKVMGEENKMGCYRGMGDFIAMRSNFKGVIAKTKCEKIKSPEGQFQCKDEAYGVLFYHPQKHDDIKRICNGLPKDKKNICLDA